MSTVQPLAKKYTDSKVSERKSATRLLRSWSERTSQATTSWSWR